MSGIYVHIPFCVKKCRYCDFISFASPHALEGYFHLLKTEIARIAPDVSHMVFDTVFFGGGTPSIAPEGKIGELMSFLRESFPILPDAEITIESNPGTLSLEKLKEYRAAGINRLSIGLQSASDTLLKRIGRIHTFDAFLASYRMAREAGFQNINIDVMYGLPGQTEEDFLATLRTLLMLAPEHISAYSLILEEGTPLYAEVLAGRETLPEEDAVCDMQEAGQALLRAAGYAQYEISNYARPERECRHNLNYWENGEYLGLGVAAHGARRQDGKWMRVENATDLKEYASLLEAGRLPHSCIRQIDRREEQFESVMLGLRMVRGLHLARFEERFGIAFENAYPEAIKTLNKKGWLTVRNGYAALTDHGLNMQNSALVEFME